jgi:hypothetical protein
MIDAFALLLSFEPASAQSMIASVVGSCFLPERGQRGARERATAATDTPRA